MGICFNPGNGLFKIALNSEIYVDKTGMIAYTNSVICSEQRYLCVSRPRRFGKSMAMNMLEIHIFLPVSYVQYVKIVLFLLSMEKILIKVDWEDL